MGRTAAMLEQTELAAHIGRPCSYTEEIGEIICARLIGGESLRSICEDEDLPYAGTVHRWLASMNPELASFREQYERARAIQAETIFDEIIDIADDARNDWMERNDGENVAWTLNGEHVQRSRVRIDARKWMAGKLAPKKYGDRMQLANDPESPLNPNPGLDVSLLTTEERQALRLLLNATVERMRERDAQAIEDKT